MEMTANGRRAVGRAAFSSLALSAGSTAAASAMLYQILVGEARDAQIRCGNPLSRTTSSGGTRHAKPTNQRGAHTHEVRANDAMAPRAPSEGRRRRNDLE